MLTRIIVALVSFMLTSMTLAAQFGVTLTVSPPSGGDTPFTALHTYYISPTGSDGNKGASPATAWATPNHALNCGDVIIAQPGTYATGFRTWGAVSNCPSTTGGIDGKGGIYFATLLCGGSDLESCLMDNTTETCCLDAFGVNANNWAVEGWKTTTGGNSDAYIMEAAATGTTQKHHIAFINDICYNSHNGLPR